MGIAEEIPSRRPNFGVSAGVMRATSGEPETCDEPAPLSREAYKAYKVYKVPGTSGGDISISWSPPIAAAATPIVMF